ncbi:MAG: hypothetical protein BGP13_23410 [Sphingobacteriales bacterium 40-81]|nr:MAG: hypothetical protein BGP13_23410 [Sphingobacteriales bacterium 40-81]
MKSRIYAILVISAFVIPSFYYIIIGRESFPFSQAPMFGHYIGKETNFYDFKYFLVKDTSEQEIYPDSYGGFFSKIAIKRYFFNNVYVSVEKISPFGYIKNDNKEMFENRMSRFFTAYFQSHNQDTTSKIRLDVYNYNRNGEFKQKHTIGYYDITNHNFIHTWK